jgi:UDP-N-acetylmuramate dehydrogenase
MKARRNASLKLFNTLGIEASAGTLLEIEDAGDLPTAPQFDARKDFVLGGGSNVVLASDVPGTVFLNRIRGRQIIDEHGDQVWIEAGAGEDWHALVEWSLELGLSGLENLSLIPGLAGAAPVQNIGAYGVELSSVLESVTAWDFRRSSRATLNAADCALSYRDSRFKSVEPDRFFITSIRLRLSRKFTPRLEYAGLREELGSPDSGGPTARDVSQAVIRLRTRKLPDPRRVGNAGSFFKNPVVPDALATELRSRHPGLPAWPDRSGKSKLSAGWLIEACGLKGARRGGAAVSEQHALVIVNDANASGRDVLELSRDVASRVEETFGVRLEPEPRIVQFGNWLKTR